jgi:adenylate cyclase
MAIEIERKFLLRDEPVPRLAERAGAPLRQGYLAIDRGVEVRVRIGLDSATVTIKAGYGIARTEVELQVDVDDAEELWNHTEGRRIDKVRYMVELDQATSGSPPVLAEVDVYRGALHGLRVVEVEFDDEAKAAAFAPPSWFGREVTGVDGWGNASLALHGAPREFIDESS